MKNHLLLIVVMFFILSLNSCRQLDSITEPNEETVIQNEKSNDDAYKRDTIRHSIPPTDPPVKDGQQWKHKND
ncbi:hypothetical protein [uncultured Chryseobacterium sp.]|jgi:hypothetical protein|uniref:hypothetical protein n=1 Tax=uncultured Chryseobacterium sp. TaxID=259322 RepID=UPI0026049406|nr:hypothetical protein [uncultured Chryseobacterium sp.]